MIDHSVTADEHVIDPWRFASIKPHLEPKYLVKADTAPLNDVHDGFAIRDLSRWLSEQRNHFAASLAKQEAPRLDVPDENVSPIFGGFRP